MAQFDFGNLESPLSGTVFINGNLEPWRDALHSSHKGGTRPSYAVEGMMWVNDTTNPWVLNMFDGSNDIAIGTFDTTTNVFTPSGVSQAAEDISFDNTDSGLAATNVQDAIDEAVSDFSDFEGRAEGFATAAQGALADTAVQPSDLVISNSFTSANQTITAAGLLTIPHGLGVVPEFMHFFLRCTVANIGFSIGDTVQWGTVQYSNPSIDVSRGFVSWTDATNVYVRFGTSDPTFTLYNKGTGVIDNITNTSWALIVKAYA